MTLCSREPGGVPCGRDAAFYPAVAIWAEGYKRGTHPPLRIVANAPMCRRCALENPPPWLTEVIKAEAREAITKLWRRKGFHPGKLKANWKGLDVRAVSIKDGTHPHTRDP